MLWAQPMICGVAEFMSQMLEVYSLTMLEVLSLVSQALNMLASHLEAIMESDQLSEIQSLETLMVSTL